ncbi:MAG: four helix bundle protein, partial [bacterium]|nr:four helix bundle protein [bacterium]
DLCRGEAEETRTNLIRCAKKGFLSMEEAMRLADRYTELMKAISGFVRYLKTRYPIERYPSSKKRAGHETIGPRNPPHRNSPLGPLP